MSFWAGKHVCVTGGTGFLGFHLVRQLRDLGANLRSFALAPAETHPIHQLSDVEQIHGDVRDAEAVHQALAGCEVVFHTAGTVGFFGVALARMHSVHVDGTRHILEQAEPHARIVHTSSIVAVGVPVNQEPVTENVTWNLAKLAVDYVQAKRASEELALAAAARGQDVVVANPAYIVGPEDHEGAGLTRFCEKFWRGKLLAAPPGGFNLVDVRDVARGHILAAQRGQRGRRYLLGGENQTNLNFFRLLAVAAGWRPRLLLPLPWWVLRSVAGWAEWRGRRKQRIPLVAVQESRLNRCHWYCSSARAEAELGYTSRPLQETLADMHAWLAQQGRLQAGGFTRWWMRER